LLRKRLDASLNELSNQDFIGFVAIKEDWETLQSPEAHLVVGHVRVGSEMGELVAAKIWKDRVDRMVVAYWDFRNPRTVVEILDVPRISRDPVGLAKELFRDRFQGRAFTFDLHDSWSG
jgi:hypothetical protein